MIMAIDIGNTNMEFGIFEKDQLILKFRLVTNRNVTSDEIGLFASQFYSIHQLEKKDVEDIIISSVVPQVMYSVTNAMKKYFEKRPLIIGENIEVDIENLYGNPKEVGADRLVNSYAAYQKYKGAMVVVDFGTATTFDVVSRDGAYLGGTIYPGIKISMEALYSNAAKLPKVEISIPDVVIGKDTVSSMQSGVIYGYSGAVDHMIDVIEEELGESVKVVATGGLASTIHKRSRRITHIEKSLTLEGLLMIYKHHASLQE